MNSYQPLQKATRLDEQCWPDDVDPLVTIQCVTYNHAGFISETIEGFLRQETNFPVRILIHDDASDDGTRQLVEDYSRAYPGLIHAVCQDQNLFSRGIWPGEVLSPLITSRYVADCEGDDFWTDPRKLQIQISFLESHPEISVSCHDAIVVSKDGHPTGSSAIPNTQRRDFTDEELRSGHGWLLTLSMVYRNLLGTDHAPEARYIRNLDMFTACRLGRWGGSKYHHEIAPACYRKHTGGIWSGVDRTQKLKDQVNSWFWIHRYWDRVGDQKASNSWFDRWGNDSLKLMNEVLVARSDFSPKA